MEHNTGEHSPTMQHYLAKYYLDQTGGLPAAEVSSVPESVRSKSLANF